MESEMNRLPVFDFTPGPWCKLLAEEKDAKFPIEEQEMRQIQRVSSHRALHRNAVAYLQVRPGARF